MARRVIDIAIAALLGVSGCVPVQLPAETVVLVRTSERFDSEASAIAHHGPNRIRGNAFLMTQGGSPRTCAGFPAELVRDTPYSRERVVALYGNPDAGFRKVQAPIVQFEPVEPGYETAVRTVTCDSDGEFEFSDVPDGSYFIVTSVGWYVPTGAYTSRVEGGRLMQHVIVEGGQSPRLIMTER